MKYYAVRYQNQKEIFTSWDECKEYLLGKKGFSQKKLFVVRGGSGLFK